MKTKKILHCNHILKLLLLRALKRVRLATALVLLLLLLDRLLALVGKEHLLIHLVLLVLAHQLVQLTLGVLHVGHQVLRRIPRQPASNLANVQIVLRVLTLQHLGKHLRLLHGRERATHLDATDVRPEVDLGIKLLLKLLLVLQKKHLVLLVDIRRLHLLIANLHEVLRVLQQVVNLDGVLLGDKRHEVLQTLHLPLVVHPRHELLEVELVLLLDHLLGAEKRDNAVTLVRNLGVFVEIVNTAAVVLGDRELLSPRHFFNWVSSVKIPLEDTMYDLYTCAAIFFLLCPGVLVPALPGSVVFSALLHAIVFYVVLYYLSNFIPWWLVWVVTALVLVGRLSMSPSQ